MFSPVKLPTLQRRSHLCEINKNKSSILLQYTIPGPCCCPFGWKIYSPPVSKKQCLDLCTSENSLVHTLVLLVLGLLLEKRFAFLLAKFSLEDNQYLLQKRVYLPNGKYQSAFRKTISSQKLIPRNKN